MNHSFIWPLALLVSSFAASSSAAAEQEILSSISLHPALEISLFAREPDVEDPVAITFDESGRMYVVEMRDYPYGSGPDRKPMGTVRLLQDTNRDGRADKSTVFAKELSSPTSIAPWKGGVIVTAPPQIIYLKDTNDDGVADVREVLFEGFVLGVTDSNVNGLRWGLDGRVHGLNGGNSGTITSPKNRSVSVPLGNADFSFEPGTPDFATTFQSSAGFGLAFDDFGRSFVTYNIDHIQHRHIPLKFLQRNQLMPAVNATTSISDHEVMSRIYPISKPVTRENHPEQSGHFSSAGGVGILNDTRWPREFYGNILIGDVVGNLIHRDVIAPDGASFKASRAPEEKESEFLASRDSAARFVAFETGPDGALYLADMQRDVIEHPDYIPEKIKQKINLRAGEDRGRIFRVVPKEAKERFRPVKIDRRDGTELVQHLESRNPWVRMTAHRLLIEDKHESAVGPLRTLLKETKSAQAAVHTLHLLQALGGLKKDELLIALRREEQEVQENALLLLEKVFPPKEKRELLPSDLEKAVLEKLGPSERLDFVAAMVLGDYASENVNKTLKQLWNKHDDSKWVRAAVLSSIGTNVNELLLAYLGTTQNKEPEAVKELAEMVCASGSGLKAVVSAAQMQTFPVKQAIVDGLNAGLQRTGLKVAVEPGLSEELKKLAPKESPELFGAVWELFRTLKLPENAAQKEALAGAFREAVDTTAPWEKRIAAVQLLRFSNYEKGADALEKVLESNPPAALQKEVTETLRRYRHDEAGKLIVRHWPSFAPSLRTELINFLLSRPAYHEALVIAVESKEIAIGELNLDLEQRRTLLRESTPEIQARAAKFIGDEEYSNRKETVSAWIERLPAEGNAAKGKEVFVQVCAKCHKAGDLGIHVGPDLTSVSHRSVEDLLSNILDPNMAINPAYLNYMVHLQNGDVENGILQSETGSSITLLQAEGKETTIPRNKIKQIRSSRISLMPEGLEAGLQPEDLRNLIAFLQTRK